MKLKKDTTFCFLCIPGFVFWSSFPLPLLLLFSCIVIDGGPEKVEHIELEKYENT